MLEHELGININRVPARRLYNWNAALCDVPAQISGRCDPIFKILVLRKV
jgi:hypothetical protein